MKIRKNLDEWLQKLVEKIPVEMASVMFLQSESEELEIFGSLGFSSPPEIVLPVGVGIAGLVIEKNAPEIVNNVAEDERFQEDDHDTRQLLVFPLVGKEGRAVGVINLSNPLGETEFDEKHLAKIEEFLNDNPIDYQHYISGSS
ncbi:MAG: GAF domain-containing protein [bacterium]